MESIIAVHNRVRSELGLSELVWSEELAMVAREWALYLAKEKGCRLQHRPQMGSDATRYGENLYWASGLRHSDGRREVQKISPAHVVASWAGESADFDAEMNSCREQKVCGHYTQIVWRATQRVGCAMSVCPDKGQVWVCNYDPPGNIVGEKPF